jgi:hypothetical protein
VDNPRLPVVRWRRFFFIIIWSVGFAFSGWGAPRPASAAISLLYFEATAEIEQVRLDWATATEINNAAFYVQRSLSENGNYQRVSPRFDSQGDDVTGWIYTWTDDAVVSGTTYWYRLEAIDTNDNSSFYDTVSAIPIAPATTSTATLTSTAGETATPTASVTIAPTDNLNPTSTSTPITPAPTVTRSGAYPAPGSLTPTSTPGGVIVATPTIAIPVPTQPTPSPSATQPISGTATLIPMDITPEFPEGGIVIAGRETATLTPAVAAAQPVAQPTWYPGGAILLVVVLVLIWILLGVWFYFSFRQLD